MSSNTTLSSPRRPFPDIATSELFMHFRCNNNPLSEFEAQVFKDQTLSAALGNLYAVESHIEDLEAQLAAAVAERGRCQQTVDECHGVLSSLRGFPPEILTEIFRWSCIMSNNVVDIAQGPWLISHVCSVWRRIVLSTPSLWIYISLCNSFLLHNRRTYPSDSCALLRAALSRSKDLLLRVNFRKDIDLEGGAHGAARRINNDWLDIVMGASERWQHCYFYFHQGAGDERRLAVVKGRINQLETLGVQFSSAFRSAVVEVVDTFQIAPKLWSVEFYEVNCHRFKLPLAQLTRVREYWDRILFEGQDMGPPPQKPLDSLQRYMAYSPALRHLHLAHHLLSKHPSYDAPLISHTLLRSLTITDEYLLDILDLPSLEELNIKSRFCPLRDSGHNDDIPDCPRAMYQSILKLLQRSSCPLKCLKVTDPVSDVLCDILRLTPALEELKLRYNHIEGYIVSDLIDILNTRQNPHLLRLQNLSLVFRTTALKDGQRYHRSLVWLRLNWQFAESIVSRHKHFGGRLQNVRIVSHGFRLTPVTKETIRLMEEPLERLRECKANGMDISVIALYCPDQPKEPRPRPLTKVVHI